MKLLVIGFSKDEKQRIMFEDSCMHYTTAFTICKHAIKKDVQEIYRKTHTSRFVSGNIDLDCIDVNHTILTRSEERQNLMCHVGFPGSIAESIVIKTDAIITVVCEVYDSIYEYYILCSTNKDNGERFKDVKEWIELTGKEEK